MIKLIATDLDGTLLSPARKVPEGFPAFAEKLMDRGIRIAAVSGRESFHITPHFAGLTDRILIAGNNGAVFFDGCKVFDRNPLPMEQVHAICRAVENIPGLSVVLSGEKKGYLWEKTVSRELMEFLEKENPPERIRQIFPVCGDPFRAAEENHDFIGKVAFFHAEDSAKYSFPAMEPFRSECQICASELNWVNVMKTGVDKGMAIRRIQQYLGVTPEETMVFGDYLNDISMFEHAKYSYAVENARPELKAIAYAIAPANTEGGVLQILRKEFSDIH